MFTFNNGRFAIVSCLWINVKSKRRVFQFFCSHVQVFFNVKIRPVLRSTEQVATGRMTFSRRVFSSTSLRLGIKIKSHFCDKAFYFGRAMINVYHFNWHNGRESETLNHASLHNSSNTNISSYRTLNCKNSCVISITIRLKLKGNELPCQLFVQQYRNHNDYQNKCYYCHCSNCHDQHIFRI